MNEIRPREMRELLRSVHERMKQLPNCLGKNPYPLKHSFADGLYIREISVPATHLTITARHKKQNVTVVTKGKLSILEVSGEKFIEAPALFITEAGTQRAIYHHTDVVLTTIHANPTNETDIDKLEDMIFAFDFEEPQEDNVIEIAVLEAKS